MWKVFMEKVLVKVKEEAYFNLSTRQKYFEFMVREGSGVA